MHYRCMLKIVLSPLTKSLTLLITALFLSNLTLHTPLPEQTQNLWHALPAFFIFCIFVFTLFSWGSLVRISLKLPYFSWSENKLFDLAIGVALFYGMAYLLTLLHLFSSQQHVFLWCLLTLPVYLNFRVLKLSPTHFNEVTNFSTFLKENSWLSIPILIVVIKLIEGLQFPKHGDAYLCYLPGPRIWAVEGSFNPYLHFSQFFLTTSWESLYAWGTALMGLKGGVGLDLTQFFAQWCTGGIAVGGVFLATLSLCQRLSQIFPLSKTWFAFICVSAMQLPSLRWNSNLAKNDFGVAFLGFSAFYFTYFLAPLSNWATLFAGILAGVAVIGKLPLVFFGFSLTLTVFLKSRKKFAIYILGGFLGVLPVLARNYFLTGDPVFPWLPNLFPTQLLGPTLSAGATRATQHFLQGYQELWVYFKELFLEFPLILTPIILIIASRERKQIWKQMSGILLSLVLFTLLLRSSTEIRYQNASLVVCGSLSAFFAFYLISRIIPKENPKIKNMLSVFLAIGILITSNITTFTLFQIGSSKFQALPFKLPHLTDGVGKLWIRQNLKSNQSILIIGDPHLYYLIDYPITELGQSREWDTKMNQEPEAVFKESLKHAPFDFLYLANDLNFFNQVFETARIMAKISVEWDERCKKTETKNLQIWDLRCLQSKRTI